MRHAQDKKLNSGFERRKITGVLAIFALAVAGLLLFATAPGSVVADSSRSLSVARTERTNSRISMRHEAAAALAAPFFAAITVDRTDDAAAASACTAAANDCSLRGAVA